MESKCNCNNNYAITIVWLNTHVVTYHTSSSLLRLAFSTEPQTTWNSDNTIASYITIRIEMALEINNNNDILYRMHCYTTHKLACSWVYIYYQGHNLTGYFNFG